MIHCCAFTHVAFVCVYFQTEMSFSYVFLYFVLSFLKAKFVKMYCIEGTDVR